MEGAEHETMGNCIEDSRMDMERDIRSLTGRRPVTLIGAI